MTADNKDTGNAGDQGGTGGGDSGHSNDQGDNQGSADGESVRDPEAVLAKNTELLGKLKTANEQLAEFETAAEERRKAELSENEKAIEAAEKAGYDRAAGTFGKQLLEERIFARATGVLQDPSDAVAFIDSEGIGIDDAKAIDAAIEELVKEKPHLKATKRRSGINQGPVGEPASATSANDWIRKSMGR